MLRNGHRARTRAWSSGQTPPGGPRRAQTGGNCSIGGDRRWTLDAPEHDTRSARRLIADFRSTLTASPSLARQVMRRSQSWVGTSPAGPQGAGRRRTVSRGRLRCGTRRDCRGWARAASTDSHRHRDGPRAGQALRKVPRDRASSLEHFAPGDAEVVKMGARWNRARRRAARAVAAAYRAVPGGRGCPWRPTALARADLAGSSRPGRGGMLEGASRRRRALDGASLRRDPRDAAPNAPRVALERPWQPARELPTRASVSPLSRDEVNRSPPWEAATVPAA